VKRKKQLHKQTREVSPLAMLTDVLDAVRCDLRRTIRAYAVRLELDLAESIAAVTRYKRTEELSRERLHDIRDLTIMMRKRKLKPEKGRRKDVRKLDSLIRDLHSIAQPNADHSDSK
jgi:thioesterase domain-containing protein